jgi:Tfp pilus assembly pilus retraction ATPase PilT
MAALAWDRIMETCVRNRGTDIVLVPGMPPFVRLEGGLRALSVEPVSASDIAQMLLELKPPDQLNPDGYLDFFTPYRADCFRVASFGIPSPHCMILALQPRSKPGGESPAK